MSALRERMWCLACGTVTDDSECDCTQFPEQASKQNLVNYGDAMAEEARKLRVKLDRVEKERDEARTILAELVDRDLSYQGENIVIPTAGHGNGIALVNRARRILARSTLSLLKASRRQNREESE